MGQKPLIVAVMIADPWHGAALSLIPELEQVVQHGSREKRVETLQRITASSSTAPAPTTNSTSTYSTTYSGCSSRRSRARRAPSCSTTWRRSATRRCKVLRTLAKDDDITVAGPVLKLAPCLPEADLVDVAKTKSQAHLRAISARRVLGEAVTDVLVGRGDREVARRVADNRGARISEMGFSRLVKRAADDGDSGREGWTAAGYPAADVSRIADRATAVVHKRLLASATPELKSEIRDVLAKVSKEVGARVGPRDYNAAQRVVLSLNRAGQMNEAALAAFCSDGKYEEAVVGLAALAKVPISVVDRLMGGERPDPVLILCKAAGLGWPTVKAHIPGAAERQGHLRRGVR